MIVLEKTPNENSRAYALRVLRHNIVNLELEPGAAISENEISSALHLSRTPVREALIELSKNSLVDIQPQRGSYISKINYDIIEESRFVRLVLELAILRIACIEISDEYKIQIEANLAEQKLCLEKDDVLKLLSLDNAFHELLFAATGKQWTYNILDSHMLHFDRLRVLTLKNLKGSKTVEDHEKIYSAIIKHDRDLAEAIMTSHLNRHNMDKEDLLNLFPDYFS